MLITINLTKICTELAHTAMLKDLGITETECWYQNNTDAQYTEIAQRSFNQWYDFYWDIIDQNKEENV